MRLLLTVAIIVAISVIGWSVYDAYSTKQFIEGLSETPVSTQRQVNDSAAMAVTPSFPGSYSSIVTSGTSSEHDPLNVIEESTFESFEESTFESSEEVCCSESSGDGNTQEKRAPSLEELREIWTRKYGDIPEIDTYITLAKKMGNRETMTLEEDRTFLKLVAFFHPVEANIKAYETFKKLFSEATPDTYRSSYTGAPPPLDE